MCTYNVQPKDYNYARVLKGKKCTLILRNIRIRISTRIAAVSLFDIVTINLHSKSLIIRSVISLPVLVPPGYDQKEEKTNK